ncbi:hypothetical protein AQUCO_00400687v1 [Aquilegia coerulea]|uniref:Phytocyanin domain-containing protein n=1 Tax=Aquilegia coerulea TaxID=218851 RepID=A0A2G5EW65_AQUCA|nr:hypothetical protein AQUCO_00400687v1 [Aquilegia coerulea]
MSTISFSFFFFYFFFSSVLLLSSCSTFVEAYKNYTVGDSLGWYDNSEKSTIDYQKWASGKDFSLGDFLMFNTDSNHSVVQTYNITTYTNCDSDDADTDDTILWSEAEPSAIATRPVTVSVPLLKEGVTYFFSGDYDGDQCKHGQHFKINVAHGQGLPKSLKDPSMEAPSPMSPDDEDSTPTPDTVVPSNFNHPKDITGNDNDNNVKKTSGSTSLQISLRYMNLFNKLSGLLVVLLGTICICY